MAVILAVALVILAPIIGALLGGAVSWCVGLVFGNLILGFLAQHGISGYTMFEIGVIFGFLGGFLRSPVTTRRGDR